MATATNGSDTLTFAYNADGLRTSKTVNDVTYTYYYADGKLIRQTGNGVTLDFYYDDSGLPYALKYNGETIYYYIVNVQGDVLGIVDSNGATVATYEYDPYGKIISATSSMTTTIGVLNPLRYRSYIYDQESQLYYLQSRYYDPETGRFINADDASLLGANGDFASLNLFAYCGNNPIAREDDGGELWHVAFGAILGGALSGGAKLIECIANGDSVGKTISKVLVSTACGAVGGALAATGIGVVGQAVIGGVLGAAESAANQLIDTGSIDTRTLMVDTASGIMGGAIGGKGASHGSKFMSYQRSQFLKNASLDGLDTAFSKLSKHTWNWAKTNLADKTALGVLKAFGGNKITNYGLKGVVYACDTLTGMSR